MLKLVYTCGKCNKEFVKGRQCSNPLNENELSFGINGVRYIVKTELCDECQKIYNLRNKSFLEEIEKEFKLYEK